MLLYNHGSITVSDHLKVFLAWFKAEPKFACTVIEIQVCWRASLSAYPCRISALFVYESESQDFECLGSYY